MALPVLIGLALACAGDYPAGPEGPPRGEARGTLDPANSKTVDLGGGNYLCFGLAATVIGTPGDDNIVLDNPGARDVVVGLGGNDTIVLDDDQDADLGDVACGGPGMDTITGGPRDDFISGEGDRDVLAGGSGKDLIVGGDDAANTMEGGDGDDHMVGGGGADTLRGGPGHDFLNGRSGPNVIEGGEGDDYMDGGANADMFDGGPGFDTIRRLNCSQGDVATSSESVQRSDCADADKDTILDGDDNCPDDANPDQVDTDEDGLGDACDPETPGIDIEKATNGQDADTAPGPALIEGAVVNWTYLVTNTGSVSLIDITVTDDQGVVVTCPKTTLATGEFMTCTGSGTVVLGQYANLGTATGTPSIGPDVSDSDLSHYVGNPGGGGDGR